MSKPIVGGWVVCRPQPLIYDGKNWNGLTLMSDLHLGSPNNNEKLILKELKTAKENGDRISLNGDVFDSIVSTDPRYVVDVIHPKLQGRPDLLNGVLDMAVDIFSDYADSIDMIGSGNHECFDSSTEVLTENGFKLFSEVKDGEKIAGFDTEKETVQYEIPERVVSYDYDGDLYYVQSQKLDFAITPNHRMVYEKVSQIKKNKTREWKKLPYNEIDCFNSKVKIALPLAGPSGNDEYQLSDDLLRLTGWILTDCNISKTTTRHQTPRITFYQRPQKSHLITDILDNLGYEYVSKTRERKILSICGRELKKPCQPACEIRLKVSPLTKWIIENFDNDKEMPWFVSKLSDRQFAIVLDSIVDGDGTKRQQWPDSLVVYGKKSFLDKLQVECVTHSFRATLKEYHGWNGSHWKLNVNKKWNLEFNHLSKNLTKKHYLGKVWCATLPSDTLVTRRNGKVLISGNTKLVKNTQLDLTALLIDRLRPCVSKQLQDTHVIHHGGYAGFIDYRFVYKGSGVASDETRGKRYVVSYYHGNGGGAGQNKGMGDFSKRMWVRCDLMWMAHRHCRNTDHTATIECPEAGWKPAIKERRSVRTSAYGMFYNGQSQKSITKHGRRTSWAADEGFAPEGLGGARVEIRMSPRSPTPEVRIIQ